MSNSRNFVLGHFGHGEMDSVQRTDLSRLEVQRVENLICRSRCDDPDYHLRCEAHPFLQGCQLPKPGYNDGWVLIEFWTYNKDAITKWVNRLNEFVFAPEEK